MPTMKSVILFLEQRVSQYPNIQIQKTYVGHVFDFTKLFHQALFDPSSEFVPTP